MLLAMNIRTVVMALKPYAKVLDHPRRRSAQTPRGRLGLSGNPGDFAGSAFEFTPSMELAGSCSFYWLYTQRNMLTFQIISTCLGPLTCE